MLTAFPFGCQPWNRLTVISLRLTDAWSGFVSRNLVYYLIDQNKNKVSCYRLTATVIVSSAASGNRPFVTKAGLFDGCELFRYW
ncbi:Uncharacterized protein APZ42_017019 [Daphnia magna]|uniref:Uncharacterized protein n=1 Tax=Daphnia magna TaxID=35525 RepID=A0A165AAI3_9CRUS|nr:Uncharacterized protein APZ42_017019 [Daphnia magna]